MFYDKKSVIVIAVAILLVAIMFFSAYFILTSPENRSEYSKGSILDWMGCDVQYDKENERYYLRTYHVNPLIIEGAYDVIIKSDGTVLAIWVEK